MYRIVVLCIYSCLRSTKSFDGRIKDNTRTLVTVLLRTMLQNTVQKQLFRKTAVIMQHGTQLECCCGSECLFIIQHTEYGCNRLTIQDLRYEHLRDVLGQASSLCTKSLVARIAFYVAVQSSYDVFLSILHGRLSNPCKQLIILFSALVIITLNCTNFTLLHPKAVCGVGFFIGFRPYFFSLLSFLCWFGYVYHTLFCFLLVLF